MSGSLLRNTFWQFLGRAISSGSGLILIPLGLHYFTAEQYGVIGVYLSYVAVIGIISLGLPAHVNRELSLLLAKDPSPRETAGLVRSFEVYFFAVTLLCFIVLFTLAYLMPRYWLQLNELTPEQVTSALKLAALTGALRFPLVFYNNILYAQERHKLTNMWLAALSVLRVLATYLLLEYVGATLENFFYAQAAFYFIEVAGLKLFFWAGHWAHIFTRPDLHILHSSRGMAFSLMAVTISGHIKTQSDKIILSYLLPLAEFGIYSAAYSIAMCIVPLAYSVVQASFPVMNKHAAEAERGEPTTLPKTLSQSTILLLMVTVPPSLALMTQLPNMLSLVARFSDQAPELSENIRIMLIGSSCYVLSLLPNMYHISRGRPNTLLWVNLSFIPPYMAMIFFLVHHYGLTGASWSFTLLQSFFMLTHFIILLPKRFSAWHHSMKIALGYVALLCVAFFPFSFWPHLLQNSPDPLVIALVNCAYIGIVSLALTRLFWKRA